MATADDRAGGVARDLGVLMAGGGVASGLTDAQLIGRFVGLRGEAAELAFEAIVRRHGPMVRGVCRRVLRDPGDEGDAFQATFLVLARKAGSVRVEGSLGPWLHGVSLKVARRARAVSARRKGRERTNADAPDLAASDDSPDLGELRSAIDEELNRLPGRYGPPLVLFYLEGLSQEETAERLGCPVGTVRSRLARGRDLLRDRLARRGLAPAAVPPMLSALAKQSITVEAISASTARLAARLAAGPTLGGVVPPGVAALVAGVSRMMTLRKFAPIAALSATVVLGTIGLAIGQSPRSAKARAKPAPAQKAEPADEAAGFQGGADAGSRAGAGEFDAYPSFVVQTVPPTGTVDVDPKLAEIRVTFSKEMQNGNWGWNVYNKETTPQVVGSVAFDPERRTFTAPVKLEPGKTYAVSINTPKSAKFKDTGGMPSVPYMLVFKTRK